MLDTNILISGMLFRGPERQLLEIIQRRKLSLVVNNYILEETNGVLARKFPRHAGIVDRLMALLNLEQVPLPHPSSVEKALKVLRDKKDAVILASAMEAKPDLFVSGDLDLHTPEVKSLVKTVTSREALEILRQRF
ncbi:putative toxin-antitoxin system toxin component, PIN family [Desulfothermobacter acidiphilus]|uniref:putative toxin-antitoxin system toxin component, PIN family n=1 Tax=Desulfothermobacter acidiphilus TaxID=1938353 RepID=UPI003F8AD233